MDSHLPTAPRGIGFFQFILYSKLGLVGLFRKKLSFAIDNLIGSGIIPLKLTLHFPPFIFLAYEDEPYFQGTESKVE